MIKDNLLTIKEFSALCRTTIRTIRFYDHKGLIKPTYVDSFTKYRYYSPLQIRDYFRIKLLHTFNIPLNEVGKSLKSNNKQGLLDNRLTKLEEQINEKEREYRFLSTMKKFLFETENAETFLQEKTIGPYLLFCKLIEKGQYDQINTDIFKLLALAKNYKIPITDKQMVFYLEPVAFKPKNTRLEIGLICEIKTSPKNLKIPENHYFRTFPKTNVKFFNYEGPFEYITLIYQRFHENRQNRTLKPNEQGFDIHLRGPWNEVSEFLYQTEIVFPAPTPGQ